MFCISLKKIAELQSNADQIASTVKDISGADRQIYILIAERIQDLVFVSKFVSIQQIIKDNHACLTSAIQIEGELKDLHEKVASEAGDHHLSLARFEKIEHELHALKTAFEKNQFDQITQVAQDLDRDLVS